MLISLGTAPGTADLLEALPVSFDALHTNNTNISDATGTKSRNSSSVRLSGQANATHISGAVTIRLKELALGGALNSTLPDGTVLYVSLWCENRAGSWSTNEDADGVYLDTTPPAIGSIVWPDLVWIEKLDTWAGANVPVNPSMASHRTLLVELWDFFDSGSGI